MQPTLSRRAGWLLAFGLAVGLMAAPAPAQCIADGLDGGSPCDVAAVNLPDIPAFDQTIRFVCFEDCDVRLNKEVCVEIEAPRLVDPGTGVICAMRLIRFEIRTCSAVPKVLWAGRQRAFYSRTWTERTDDGRTLQVWRFLLNGDLLPSQFLINHAGQNPCGVPDCFETFGKVFFWGHVDYVRDCENPDAWQVAWALHHECDEIEHRADGQRPGVFHPDHSISFVGPSAGFVPAMVAAVGGPVGTEAVRRNDFSTIPDICRFEDPLADSVVDTGAEFCLCGGGPARYHETSVSISTLGGSAFASAPGVTGMVEKAIGTWLLAGSTYPGTETLLSVAGDLTWVDGCNGIDGVSHLRGVASQGGYPAETLQGTPLPATRKFLDLGTADRRTGGPLIGVPFVSWWILNLNPL